ncbi:SGNH hydrolase-type esterase domain-containing protein [Lipomyces oligophaga]|uniref:SGNH hydrolase-type esterase domain-containing protein n=1 Tax=Lipomyces oligophaga TaxID=45792 RepID=UPI0034CFA101
MQRKTTLRLMPLGGSITYGVGSSAGNGYREFLRDLLIRQGYNINLVGSRKSGSMSNNDNEGWRGYRLDHIKNRSRRSVSTLLPEVFMINAESNDCIQNFQIHNFGERMNNMFEFFWQICPHSTVILSTLLINADENVNLRVLHVNSQIRNLVELKTAEKQKILLADMYSFEGPQLNDLVDGTHPNDEGYRKMAGIWAKAIRKAQTAGFLTDVNK